MTLQEELATLCEENPDKNYEILDGEIREVSPTEGQEFWTDPIGASPLLQKKYIGVTYAEHVEPTDWEVPLGWSETQYQYTNPFTGVSKMLRGAVPPPPPPSRKEIGDKIVLEAFEWNPHAQMVDVVSAIMGIAYLLTLSHGKENVLTALWQLPQTMETVSGIRVQEGLSAYNLSFLD